MSPAIPAAAAGSGEAFLEDRLATLARSHAEGQRCQVVFDLDNTLFDTRARTAWIAKEFDSLHGTCHFASLQLDSVGLDARQTCARIGGIPPDAAEAFAQHWERRFWDGECFRHDVPVESVWAWARRAAEIGASVCFLTGRIEALRQPTELQLASLGFTDLAPSRLWMKPDLATWTLSFKSSRLEEAMGRALLGWYATEGRNEIAHLQRCLPGGPWVLVGCSLQPEQVDVAPDTPTLRGAF